MEAIRYNRKFLEALDNCEDQGVKRQSIFPCLHLIVFGPDVGVAGSVFIRKIQTEILVPIISLDHHSTDTDMHEQTTRTLGATQTFSYDQGQILKNKRIFYAKTLDGATICIKFVKRYSCEVHKFFASKGHAPKLIA
ncbi:hypothetical protein BDR04DRAFT_1119622 [Suillus decipiens]|nr:hypothetical protein BDR04DRAFT_1119622 [Suillus decipiens]